MLYALVFSSLWLVGHVIAAADPSWTTYLLNGGPFAVVVLLIILDKLTTPGERDRLRTENTELKKQVQQLNENILRDVLPVLTQLNVLITQTVDALRRKKDDST
jgi:hypothetical protein